MSYLSAELRDQLLEADNRHCAYCYTTEANTGQPMTIDHINPQAQGGETAFESLCFSCRRCNEFKGSATSAQDPLTGETAILFHPRQQTWASEITSLDETWNLYTSNGQGFSIKFPKMMATVRGSCVWNEEQGSYRPQTALVPVKVFEDSDAVYITAEHYFELTGEKVKDNRHYYDECNQVANSLELLRDPENEFKEPFWKLVVAEIHDDSELDSFLKARYGSGCSLGEKAPTAQDGVYDVKILEDGKSLEETQCRLNFRTVVKYYPAGGKAMAWNTGQAPTFPADVNYAVTHDQEMIASLSFLATSAAASPVAPDQG